MPLCASGIFAIGDGTGGPEFRQGHVGTSDDCIQRCLTLRKTQNREINGVTISVSNPDNPACYCESRMSGHSSSGYWRTCFLTRGN